MKEGKRGKFLRGYAVDIIDQVPEQNSDVRAVIVDRVVSLTPLTFDLTANVDAAELARWGK